MKLTIIGCSDAFSSGGRYHSCYLLDTSKGRLMIDCGANSPLGLKRFGIPFSSVDAVLISHCHGDHFGGLPFLLLDKMFIERDAKPLQILGPPGIESRVASLFECFYPGLADRRAFDIAYGELKRGEQVPWQGLLISAYEVEHPSGLPSLAISVEDKGKRFSFSGDSGWCEGLFEAGRNADLYLIECTTFATRTGVHLDYLTLASNFDKIGAAKYLLTHMSEEMLGSTAKIDSAKCILAADGLSVEV